MRTMIVKQLVLVLFLISPAFVGGASAADAGVRFFGAGALSSGVMVPSDQALYFSAGVAGDTKDGSAMKEQALAVIKRLEANIAAAGFGLDDVIFARAYLTPGAGGAVDYAGWDKAWSEVFGTSTHPNKPARATVAVPILNQKDVLIEIEFVCAGKEPSKMAAGSEALGLPVTNPSLKPYGTREGRIYAGMGVMPGSSMYWTSGNNPAVLKQDAPMTSYDHHGDMYTQAHNTLAQLKANLATVGLTFGDVVYVRAFLGPDWIAAGKFDFDGWNKAYGEFFNNAEQPHKPARTTVTTPTFAGNTGGHPDTMIEVEVVAAFPKAPSLFDGQDADSRALRPYGAPEANVASGVAVKPHAAFYLSAGALSSGGGDMKTQALSALESLKGRLAEAGMNFRDVVFMRAYVVAGAEGKVDRDGWNAAYKTFFNNPQQPYKPARTTIEVYSLPKSESKIAIDVIAVSALKGR